MPRPSPALLVALLALVVSCAGSATAAVLVTTRDIKDHTIRGKDVAANTITGRNVTGLSGRDVIPDGLDGSDIDESTFDVVPHARRADSVSGLKGVKVSRVGYTALGGGDAATVYDDAGLRITASCSAAGALTARAAPTLSGGLIRLTITHPGSSPVVSVDDEFVDPESLDLVRGGAGDAQGVLTYLSPAGPVTTIQYLAHDGLPPSRGSQCILAGTATRTAP